LPCAPGRRRRNPCGSDRGGSLRTLAVLGQYLETALRAPAARTPPRACRLPAQRWRVSDIAVLADTLRRLADGECVVGPTIVSRLVNRRRDGLLTDLTERERDVLALMAEGHPNQLMCRKLFLSPKTVEPHPSNLPEAGTPGCARLPPSWLF
jgi:hypothetical protein